MTSVNRRKFIAQTAIASAGALAFPNVVFGKKPDEKKIRLGFIGVGLRGEGHVEQAIYRDDVEVVAIADPDANSIARTQKILTKRGRKEAVVYGNGDFDYENLVKRDDIDAVIIASPWEWHARQAIAAMKAGKHVGTEVPAALTVKDCWDLVNTSEKTGKMCMILENVCYRRDVMTVLNMVRQGMFGEMIHLQGGYQHDLREVKFNDGKQYYGGGVEFGEKALSEARWRTNHSVNRNGDLYPTHGIGPMAQMCDINRGNQMLYLTSMATKSRGLHNYIVEKGGENHPNAQVKFKLGDVVTTLIKCANGETIMLSHDTNLPRPYSLNFRVQGTKGLWLDDNDGIYIEGTSAKPHRWDKFDDYQAKYDHPLWKKFEKEAENAGHGGMDYFVLRAFLESVKNNTQAPIDVYDSAAWSVLCPLTEESIAKGSMPVQIPDFTRGRWKTNQKIFCMADNY